MKARLACSTMIFRELDVLESLDLIAGEGFKDVDLCIVPGVCPHFDLDNYDAGSVSRLKEHLAKRELSVVCLTLWPGYLNSRKADKTLSQVERGVDLAAELGSGAVSLLAGERRTDAAEDEDSECSSPVWGR